jgi:hypothetical protein
MNGHHYVTNNRIKDNRIKPAAFFTGLSYLQFKNQPFTSETVVLNNNEISSFG